MTARKTRHDRALALLAEAIEHLDELAVTQRRRDWRARAVRTIAGDLRALAVLDADAVELLVEAGRLSRRLSGLVPQISPSTFENGRQAVRALRAAERELSRAIEGGRG